MSSNTAPHVGTRENVSKNTWLLLHWFICSIGLTGIIYGLSWKIHAGLLAKRTITNYYEWAVPFFFPNKPQQFIFFVATGLCLFLFYSWLYVLLKNRNGVGPATYHMATFPSKGFILIYVILPLMINGIVLAGFPSAPRPRLPLSAYLLMLLWFGAVMMPFVPSFGAANETFRHVKERLWQGTAGVNDRLSRRLYVWSVGGLVFLSFAQLCAVFLPFLRGEILMMNEYMDVPEQTQLGGTYISNTQYINSHSLGGLLKYDPERDLGDSPIPSHGTYVELPMTALLAEFIERNSTKYYYNLALQAVVIHGLMTADERSELSAIVGHEHSADILSLYYESKDQSERLRKRIYSAEELQFLSKNRLEMRWQILNRWVIHHHNFVLGPINEYALGKPLNDINMQYGAFNVVLMKYLLEKTGGVSYQNYFQKWYMVWPLYYALFVTLAFVVFRDIYYVAFVCLLAFGLINKIDYQHLFLAPGLNPVRHFFDVLTMACLYLYFKRGRTAFLIVAILLGVISILNNQQFGLFLVGSLFVTMLVKAFQERGAASIREIAWGAIALLGSGAIMTAGHLGKNEMASYYLEGFLGNIIDPTRLVLIMLAISACYIILVRSATRTGQLKYFALLILVYSQGVLIYYIWGGDEKHLFNVASILVLGAAVFIQLAIDHTWVKRIERVVVGGLIVLTLLAVYVPGIVSYYASRQEYEDIFANHRTYDWNLESANFRSTMDPRYFVDSIALIQEYAPSGNAIHLISKYDNFVPFLAKKYSAMPFFDLQWFLLTAKEVNLCIDRIKTDKPQHLFVDTDIERDFNGEIVLSELRSIGYPNEESLQRVQRLHLLKDIFRAVKGDYTPVKKGVLLTVYKRTAQASRQSTP